MVAGPPTCEPYLTRDPETTYFKADFKRHTRFSVECVDIPIVNGNFIKQGRPYTKRCVLSDGYRGGDLVGRTYVAFTLPVIGPSARWVPNVGHALIKKVTLEINDKVIDCHTGEWMHIWSQLTVADKDGLRRMLSPLDASTEQVVFVPLEFQFCKHRGSQIPMARLKYCYARMNVETVPIREALLWEGDTLRDLPVVEIHVYSDIVKLDDQERRELVSHERVDYLTTQVERNVFEAAAATFNGSRVSRRLPLRFDGDYKELVIVCKHAAAAGKHDFTSPDGRNPVRSAQLRLRYNGLCAETLPGAYYNVVQPFQHHSSVPAVGINVYSFALEPESFQPSGTRAIYRADSPVLDIEFVDDTEYEVTVYATKFNVMSVMLGLGGLMLPYHPEGPPMLECQTDFTSDVRWQGVEGGAPP